MAGYNIRLLDILYGIANLAADLFVLGLLGVLLMGYEDAYDGSKGEFWSWTSMSPADKMVYCSCIVWILLHLLGLVYFVRWLYRMVRTARPTK